MSTESLEVEQVYPSLATQPTHGTRPIQKNNAAVHPPCGTLPNCYHPFAANGATLTRRYTLAATKAFRAHRDYRRKPKDVVSALHGVNGVTSVDVVTGPYDIICIVEAEDLSSVGDTGHRERPHHRRHRPHCHLSRRRRITPHPRAQPLSCCIPRHSREGGNLATLGVGRKCSGNAEGMPFAGGVGVSPTSARVGGWEE